MIFGVLITILSSKNVSATLQSLRTSHNQVGNRPRTEDNIWFQGTPHGAQAIADFIHEYFGAFCDEEPIQKLHAEQEPDKQYKILGYFTMRESTARHLLNFLNVFFIVIAVVILVILIYRAIVNQQL